MLCRICVTVQIQLRKCVLDHADSAASTRQLELDHTDQECIWPERSRSYHVGMIYLIYLICPMCENALFLRNIIAP